MFVCIVVANVCLPRQTAFLKNLTHQIVFDYSFIKSSPPSSSSTTAALPSRGSPGLSPPPSLSHYILVRSVILQLHFLFSFLRQLFYCVA